MSIRVAKSPFRRTEKSFLGNMVEGMLWGMSVPLLIGEVPPGNFTFEFHIEGDTQAFYLSHPYLEETKEIREYIQKIHAIGDNILEFEYVFDRTMKSLKGMKGMPDSKFVGDIIRQQLESWAHRGYQKHGEAWTWSNKLTGVYRKLYQYRVSFVYEKDYSPGTETDYLRKIQL